ncbi:MAG: hypothetical protein ACYCQI_09820 [Gammaproteobacteria bacterium]
MSSSSTPTPPTPPTPVQDKKALLPAGLEDSITGYYRLAQQFRETDGGKDYQRRNLRLSIPDGNMNVELDKLKKALAEPKDLKAGVTLPDVTEAVAAIDELKYCAGVMKHNITGGHPVQPELDRFAEYSKNANAALQKLIDATPASAPEAKTYLEQQQAALKKLSDETVKKDLEKLKEAADEKKQQVQARMDSNADRSKDIAQRAKIQTGEDKNALWTIWEPYRDYSKEEEVAKFQMTASDGKDSFQEAVDKIRSSKATLYKSPNSKYVISYENGQVYPMGVQSPGWPKERAGFVEGWKQATAFLALKDPDVQKYGLKISLKSPPVNTTEDKKDYLTSILEIAKHAHDKDNGLNLKVVLDDSIRRAIKEVLTDSKIKLTAEERQKLQELDDLDKLLVQEAGQRAEKKAAEDSKSIAPWDVPKREMMQQHVKDLSDGKTADSKSELKAFADASASGKTPTPAQLTDELKNLGERAEKLKAAAHEAIRVYNSLGSKDTPGAQLTDLMKEIKDEQQRLANSYQLVEIAAGKFPAGSQAEKEIKEKAIAQQDSLSSHLHDVIQPLDERIKQHNMPANVKIDSLSQDLKMHTDNPPIHGTRREDIEFVKITASKLDAACTELKRIQDALPAGTTLSSVPEAKKLVEQIREQQMDVAARVQDLESRSGLSDTEKAGIARAKKVAGDGGVVANRLDPLEKSLGITPPTPPTPPKLGASK